jgi:CHAD domain-containing protein
MNTSINTDHDKQMPIPIPKIPLAEPSQGHVSDQPSWAWAKVRKIALRQMDKFIDLLPPVLRHEDLTAVNEMRVSCRRLEEILDLIYGKPRPGHIKKLRRRLQLCRRTLGELRNCDALLAVADNAVATRRPETDAWKALSEYLRPLRARTAVVTLEKLGRLNLATPYLHIKRDFDLSTERRLNHGITKERSQAETAIVYQRIVNSLASRWREFAVAVERSHDDPCEHVIHRMRIAAKRLRYLTEVMGKLHIAGSTETLNWLKSLQGTIGVWHDLEIMERMLREIVAHRKSFKVEHLTAEHITRLIHHNSLIKKKSADMFFQMTRRSDHYLQVKHWVSEVLATHGTRTNHQ